MRILVLNPNTTHAMTERLLAAGSAVAGPSTQLVGMTAATGFPYIASRAEAQLAGAATLAMIAERVEEVDAVVIAAFGDPGLRAARDLFAIPVIGMAEAAMLSACFAGDRFALVTFSKTLRRWYEEGVALSGLGSRCAGIVVPGVAFERVEGVAEEMRDALVASAREAVATRGADVVVLAGAPLAGLAGEVKDAIGVPVVDPIAAAVLQAEAMVRLDPTPRTRASARPGKEGVGLPAALGAAMARGQPG